MSSAWSYLSKRQLQDQIGEETLCRLEEIIPTLVKDINLDTIYTRETLITIFDSFSGSEKLQSKAFRKEFLNSLPENLITSLCNATKIKIDIERSNFEDKVNAILKRGWNDREFCKSFLSELGLSIDLLPPEAVKEKPEEFLEAIYQPYQALKDFQFQVFLSARDELVPKLSRFVIQMPTGSGKTRTAVEVITDFINNSPTGRIVIWLAHSDELCEQAYGCFKQIWNHVAAKPLHLIRCWGSMGTVSSDFSESAFIVAGFQKLYALLNDKNLFSFFRERVDLIVVDEAHKVVAPTYKKVTKALMGKTARVVGLTATPGRSVQIAEENRALAEFFFNKIVTINSTKKSVIGLLKEKKVLAKAEYEPLYSNQRYELSKSERDHIERFFDFPRGMISRIGANDLRNIEIIKRLEREAKMGKQIIFFGCSVEHSKFICAMLIFLGFRAGHVDGSTSLPRRRKLIDDFKGGKINIICNYGVLSTGFDAPKTDVVFISRPTASVVLYSQMIGRGLRGPAIGGTPTCKIIDVKDNIVGFSNDEMVYDYFEEYWT